MGRRPKAKPVVEQHPGRERPLDFCPEPPSTLIGEAEGYWRRVVPLLVERGSLTSLHLEPLEALCDLWGEYRRLKAWLSADPARWTTASDSGSEAESPQAKRMYAALKELQRLWDKFGLTPHSEPRLSPKAAGGQVGGTRGAKGMTLEEWAALKTIGDEDGRPGK